ncbi:hypothetical protein ABT234_30745 [Streptomyces sp. NPDC001586]|uniref:hypothetical protein n=1 Tax=Streptomyces sp. NPDC001586 TaxID=3154387 RepID=UPI00331BDC37
MIDLISIESHHVDMDPGLAVVWGALIGVGGAIVGTLLGAITGGRAARIGARVQGQVNFNGWLRDQQRAAYAEMHATAMETVELGHRFARGGGPALKDALAGSLYKLVRAGSTVGMVGPASMKQLAGELVMVAYKVPESSSSGELWEKWTRNVTAVLSEFTGEANKIIAEPPALK